MKYRLIAVDMDGTLLNSQGRITDKTIAAIHKAVEKGVLFTICTGRPIQGVELYYDVLDTDAPVITYNGAMIVMGRSREILYKQDLDPGDARDVLEWGKKLNTTVIAWSDNKLYANELNDRVHDYKKLSLVEPILITDEDELINNGVTKFLWYDDADRIRHFQEVLADKLSEGVTYCTSKPTFLEFFNSKVSKAVAMEKIGEHFSIRREEMVAIGDGFNDLSMIEYAGLGVAMGNAPEEIKKRAGYVTLSNDDDGIAYFIDEFF
ncbi:MAG: HAD family phosphatase [Clostridiaceae bacterium]|jgi:Cof subfamily protein (haloacid dehalogenase superfamily)|nr:HAD family phosphatase [Clostridiaceae bacterium]